MPSGSYHFWKLASHAEGLPLRVATGLVMIALVIPAPAIAAKPPQVSALGTNAPEYHELLRMAECAAYAMPGDTECRMILRRIAELRALGGDRAGAERLIPGLVASARSSPEADDELRSVAVTQAAIDDPNGALQTLKLIQDNGNRDFVRSHVVHAYLGRGDHQAAIDVAQAIQDSRNRELGLIAAADILDSKGDRAAAKKVIRSLKDRDLWFGVMEGLARRSLRAGDDRPMRELIPLMDAQGSRVHGLLAIAQSRLERNEFKGARATFAEATTIAKNAAPRQTWQLVVMQAKLGDLAKSLAYLDDLDAGEPNEVELRAILIRDLIELLCRQAKYDDALQIATRLNLPPRGGTWRADDRQYWQALRDIVLSQAQRGEFDRALKIARTFAEPANRAVLLEKIALIQYRKGDAAGANATLTEARASMSELPADYYHSRDLLQYAEAQLLTGDIEGARHTIGEVLAAANGYKYRDHRVATLTHCEHDFRSVAAIETRCGPTRVAVESAVVMGDLEQIAVTLLGAAEGLLARHEKVDQEH